MASTAAIVGAGATGIGAMPDRSVEGLVAESLGGALDDAGLDPADLDGLVTNYGADLSRNYDRLATNLGLDLRFVNQTWSHGRWIGPSVQAAAMAVEAGLAEYVAAGLGFHTSTNEAVALETETSLMDADHVDRPWYGLVTPIAGCALTGRYYMERYGATSEDLAHVAVSLRRHASLNPRAHFPDPITVDDHQESRWIIEPLRLLDCAPMSDGGAYVIVTSAENAESHDDAAYIAGMEGLHAGPDEYPFARPGMGVLTQSEYDYDPAVTDRVYEEAGVARGEVDAFYTYDPFTPTVWYALERWGFCDPGTAHEFTRDGAIELDGELPVNTNGGLLSAGHICGWEHVVEMYDQLRGGAGDRQIAAETVQWATSFGDSIILRGEP